MDLVNLKQIPVQHRTPQITTNYAMAHMTIRLKMAVFWVVAPYSLVEVYQRFTGACDDALMMEGASTFKHQ
jgi:hypothetical protein